MWGEKIHKKLDETYWDILYGPCGYTQSSMIKGSEAPKKIM
jgi:hypothetical protein